MLSFEESEQLSHKIIFDRVYDREHDDLSMDNIVYYMKFDAFLNKIKSASKSWYQTARLDCED